MSFFGKSTSNIGGKLQKGIQKVSKTLVDVQNKISSEKTDIQNVNNASQVQQVAKEEDEVLSELKQAGTELENLIEMDRQEIEKMISIPRKERELEQKQENILSTAVNEFQGLDQALDQLLNSFSSDMSQYEANLEQQQNKIFKNKFGTTNVHEVLNEVESYAKKHNSNSIPSLRKTAESLSDSVENVRNDKELKGISRTNEEMIKSSVGIIERSKDNYNLPQIQYDIKEDFNELSTLIQNAEGILEQLEEVRGLEEEIEEMEDKEMQTTHSIEDLEKIVEQVEQFIQELNETELEQEEIVKLNKKAGTVNSGEFQTQQNMIQNLEKTKNKIEKEIESLEQESETVLSEEKELDNLSMKEMKELEQITNEEGSVMQKLNKARKKFTITKHREFQKTSDELEKNIKNMQQLLKQLRKEARDIGKLIEDEEQKRNKIEQKDSKEIQKIRAEISNF